MRKNELKNTRQYKEALKRTEQARKDGNLRPYAYMNNVPLTWCVRFDLTPLMLLVYCYIRDCTKNMKESAFTGSIKSLCSKFNVTLPTARTALRKLEEKGFIYKERSKRENVECWVRYRDGLVRYYSGEDERTIDEILESNSARLNMRRSLDALLSD